MEERDKLRALLQHSVESGFSAHSGAQLQDWLEKFAAGIKNRTEDLQAKIDQLTDHTASVEQELKNAFNSFRLLSNLQFIENRVYEEDETLVAKTKTDEPHRVESYENDIVPRYKDAVKTAWNEHLKTGRRSEPRQRSLPYIIGTEEFMRDPHCGLPDSRYQALASVRREYDSEAEKDGVSMAADMVASGVISDEEWSDPGNDAIDDQDHYEPAVSAAQDFKAMLEAALRASYVPSDDNSMLDSVVETGIRNGLEPASKKDDAEETSVKQATFQDILGEISTENMEAKARAETDYRDFAPPEESSSGKSSRWSESDQEEDSAVEGSKNIQESQQNQTLEPEESPGKIAGSSGSKDAIEPTKAPGFKSLFDADENDDEEEEGSLPKLPSSSTSPPVESRSDPVVSSESGSGFRRSDMTMQPVQTAVPLRSTALSKLLFGDEDNDDDDALFGPIASKPSNIL